LSTLAVDESIKILMPCSKSLNVTNVGIDVVEEADALKKQCSVGDENSHKAESQAMEIFDSNVDGILMSMGYIQQWSAIIVLQHFRLGRRILISLF
jgi:hypothetical protein